jgi:RNA polymerase sigma factor for flagellar operon FliA
VNQVHPCQQKPTRQRLNEQHAALVRAHRDLPRRAAAAIRRRVGAHVPRSELVELGEAGLAEAAARFDPRRGVPFESYAWHRVRGAILDGIRRRTPLPRGVWRQLLALRAAKAERERCAGSSPTPKAQATLAAIAEALAAIRPMYVVSLSAMPAGREPSIDSPCVTARIDAQRLSLRVASAVAELPDPERALLQRVYWQGDDLTTAGAMLGHSKSWASRLHARAIERLRKDIEAEAA